jgi:L-ascorbate metabolism protein UlaG (beta-lactamase superfamily)
MVGAASSGISIGLDEMQPVNDISCLMIQRSLIRACLPLALLGGLLQAVPLAQGEPPSGPTKVDPHLNEREDAYLTRQANAFLEQAQLTLSKLPPQYPEPRERFQALLLLDAVLHDVHAAQRPPVQQFFRSRMETALRELETNRVDQGARIWKLYNMGFIVRTRTATVAFDLVRGSSARCPEFALSTETVERFVTQCDALFISHRHGDHVDEGVARTFLAQGKPVVAPPQVWAGKPFHSSMTHLKREADLEQTLPIQRASRELKVVIFPGHQMEEVENNVSLVIMPEGLSFAHLGDQINEGAFMPDYAWIDQVAKHHHVDVLLPPCWTNELLRIAEGFRPELILPGHENELGHPIDDRVPFWGDSQFLQLTYPELKRSRYPVIVMAWGESIQYRPGRSAGSAK